MTDKKDSTPSPKIDSAKHSTFAKEADQKADEIKVITHNDLLHKEGLRNLANEHRNIASHGTPENKDKK
jgi:hypothetical protein